MQSFCLEPGHVIVWCLINGFRFKTVGFESIERKRLSELLKLAEVSRRAMALSCLKRALCGSNQGAVEDDIEVLS